MRPLLAAVALAALATAAPLPHALAQGTLVAFFQLDAPSVTVGASVHADASPSTGDITEYAWRWDASDGYAAGNRTESHAYVQPGVHVVGLRVTDASGAVAFANQSLLVKGSAPTAYLSPDRYEQNGGELLVTLNASFSTPSKGATRIVRYEWDWGEGHGFFVGNVTESHAYSEAGTYKIQLRVTDDLGRNATGSYQAVVKSTFLTRLGLVWQDRASFLQGARITLVLAVGATVLGFCFAVLLALLRISRSWFLRAPALVYIEVIRGTPLFLQIIIAWLVLPYAGIHLSILYAGGLALVVNTTAYQAEAIRAGIQAIPAGQMEAAISLGMTYLQAMRRIVVPQAFRLALPALGNEFIILLKDTSLVSAIGVVELTFIGRAFANRTFIVVEPLLVVGAIYFVMTYSLSTLLRHLEKRLAIPGMGVQTVSA